FRCGPPGGWSQSAIGVRRRPGETKGLTERGMSLSELCVRRPVFATMLVMSLVVLGIFAFRDLGVDLFPKADPATVTVTAQLPRRRPAEGAAPREPPRPDPRREGDGGRRAARRSPEQHFRHRRDAGAAHQRRA